VQGVVDLGVRIEAEEIEHGRGEVIGAFALTESGSGSDAGALKTRAEPVDGGWRISGTAGFRTGRPFTLSAGNNSTTLGGPRGGSSFTSAFADCLRDIG